MRRGEAETGNGMVDGVWRCPYLREKTRMVGSFEPIDTSQRIDSQKRRIN